MADGLCCVVACVYSIVLGVTIFQGTSSSGYFCREPEDNLRKTHNVSGGATYVIDAFKTFGQDTPSASCSEALKPPI